MNGFKCYFYMNMVNLVNLVNICAFVHWIMYCLLAIWKGFLSDESLLVNWNPACKGLPLPGITAGTWANPRKKPECQDSQLGAAHTTHVFSSLCLRLEFVSLTRSLWNNHSAGHNNSSFTHTLALIFSRILTLSNTHSDSDTIFKDIVVNILVTISIYFPAWDFFWWSL